MKKHLQIRIEPTAEPSFINIIVDKKPYSEPKLYIPKEEINGKKVPTVKPGRRWYVWFYWRTESGKLDKKIKIYKGLNEYNTVQERKAAGKALAKGTWVALQRGWDPVTRKVKQKEASKTLKVYPIKENCCCSVKINNLRYLFIPYCTIFIFDSQ